MTTVFPTGLAVDAAGRLHFSANDSVYQINGEGSLIRVAGPAEEALFDSASAVAVDSRGNVYIADTGNHRVRRIDRSGLISTVAGTGVPGYKGDGGLATAARLSSPAGLALDPEGNVYITDRDNHCVRKVTPGGIITTVAGNGYQGFSGDGGPAVRAQLTIPSHLAFDGGRNLYVLEPVAGRIRKVGPDGIITTLRTGSLNALAADTSGGVYFAENSRIIKRTPEGQETILAGSGSRFRFGDGGRATAAGFDALALAVDSRGLVYLHDRGSPNLVRKLEPANIFPAEVFNAASGLPQFLAVGGIVKIAWVDMDPAEPAAATPGPDGRYPSVLSGTRVLFDDIAAPVLSRDSQQVVAIVPYALAGRNGARLRVEHQGKRSNEVAVALRSASPGLFTPVLNEDFTLNSASNPAARASAVVFYATGEGQTTPAGIDGQIAGQVLPKPVLPVRVRIGGRPAEVLYAGVAPGLAGVMQVNARIPEALPPGSHPAVLFVDGAESQPVSVSLR